MPSALVAGARSAAVTERPAYAGGGADYREEMFSPLNKIDQQCCHSK